MSAFLQDAPTWLIVIIVIIASMVAAWEYITNPITVPEGYFNFADVQQEFGIPFIGDVLSNGAFAVIAIWGLWVLYGARDRLAIKPGLTAAFAVFFVAVLFVTFGSGYFHLDPGPDRILLDRLPISAAAGAILAILLIDRSAPNRAGAYQTLAVTMGFAALGLWHVTVTGDLRLYALTQALPVLVAIACARTWNAPQHVLPGKRMLLLALLYAGAKVSEVCDDELYEVFEVVSGHNLKHVLAAGAAAMAIPFRRSA